MGFIYIIKNSINDHVYIGQTCRTIEVRWKEHLRHCEQERSQVLGRAMRKYGKDKFFIEQLEECDDSILDEREIYWIAQFNSFHNGYNATAGGTHNFEMTSLVSEVLELW